MPTLEYEQALQQQGHRIIAGIDEAGRGPLAGPVSVAAAILPADFEHPLLNDSKKLSEKRRDRLYEELTGNPDIRWACTLVEVAEIDRINILQATYAGMRRVARQLAPDAVLIDGKPVPDFPFPSEALVKGDSRSSSIAAASIIAKVTRDRHLRELAETYPGYGFEKHKGYGTRQHLAALERLGPCPEHRRSFAPVRQMTLDLG